mgnify:CR=1 FL=1
MYDGVKVVEVIAPATMTGRTCGICGNFDHNDSNDKQLGPHLSDLGPLCPPLAPTGAIGDMVGMSRVFEALPSNAFTFRPRLTMISRVLG